MLDFVALENAILVAEHGSFRLAARVLSVIPTLSERDSWSLRDAARF